VLETQAARLAEAACFGEATCAGDLPCFDEPLKMSDSQPASLTSIGRSTNAAIAAMRVRRRDQTPRPDLANFLPDDSNPCFPPGMIFRSRLMTSTAAPRSSRRPL
jgi:hypothetical protein